MARGYADYQNPVNQVAGRLVDFSSIQTSILGLNSLDGLGRLVWLDMFHNGLSSWAASAAGTGVAPYLTTQYSENPPACVKFDVSNFADVCTSTLRRTFQFSTLTTAAVDCSVLFSSVNATLRVSLSATYLGESHGLAFEYRPATAAVWILGGAPTGKVLDVAGGAGEFWWIPLKLCLDFSADRGRHLVVGTERLDLSSYTLGGVADLNSDRLTVTIKAEALGAGSGALYLGHFYLTSDEP